MLTTHFSLSSDRLDSHITYFSVFKLWFTLRESANVEAAEFSILFPSRL